MPRKRLPLRARPALTASGRRATGRAIGSAPAASGRRPRAGCKEQGLTRIFCEEGSSLLSSPARGGGGGGRGGGGGGGGHDPGLPVTLTRRALRVGLPLAGGGEK